MRLGVHFLLDFAGCKQGILDSENEIATLLQKTATAANVTILNLYTHKFSPQGVSGAAVIAESHISIHTWPDKDYVALDIFTCGDIALPQKAVEYLTAALEPKVSQIRELSRGFKDTERRGDQLQSL